MDCIYYETLENKIEEYKKEIKYKLKKQDFSTYNENQYNNYYDYDNISNNNNFDNNHITSNNNSNLSYPNMLCQVLDYSPKKEKKTFSIL